MIGAYGNLRPNDLDYVVWKTSGSELGFTRIRRLIHAMLRDDQCKWLVTADEFPAGYFETSETRGNLSHKRRTKCASDCPT